MNPERLLLPFGICELCSLLSDFEGVQGWDVT